MIGRPHNFIVTKSLNPLTSPRKIILVSTVNYIELEQELINILTQPVNHSFCSANIEPDLIQLGKNAKSSYNHSDHMLAS